MSAAHGADLEEFRKIILCGKTGKMKTLVNLRAIDFDSNTYHGIPRPSSWE